MRAYLSRILAVCLALVVLAPLARAQDDDSLIHEAGPFAIPYTSRDLGALCRAVGFDQEQTGSARTLHQGYRAAYRGASTKARKQMQEVETKAREGQDWSEYAKKRGELTIAYVEDIRKLEAGLLDDLKALCTPAQVARFPSAERARRRETGLILALGNGERLDLASMLETLKIDRHASPTVEELLTRWETDVDRLLQEKDKLIHEGMKATMGGAMDADRMEKMKKFTTDLATLCSRVGEANRRAATELQGLLPEGQRDAFAAEVKLRSFPRIYGPSVVTKAIKTAQDMKGLTGDQQAKLKELSESYQREAGPINNRWAAAAEEKQRQLVNNFMEMMQNDGGKDPADPFVAARKERRDLDEKYHAKIESLLTAEQKAQLPKAEPHRGDIPEFLPDFEAEIKDRWDQWKGEGD
jgi:hypothetical protein